MQLTCNCHATVSIITLKRFKNGDRKELYRCHECEQEWTSRYIAT